MIDVKIITPTGLYKTAQVTQINARSVEGEFGLLSNHIPMVVMLAVSRLTLMDANGKKDYAISGGMLHFANNVCRILTDTIEGEEEIDLERAKKAGIEGVVVSPKDYSDRAKFNEALLDKVDSYNPDLIVLAGFLVVIPEAMIDKYENKIINIHPSLIPSFCGTGYYGLKVHEAALARGVKVSGATVHFVDEGTDTGPIILQKAVYIENGDTAEVVQKRVMEQAEWVILPKAIDLIANNKVSIVDGHAVIVE